MTDRDWELYHSPTNPEGYLPGKEPFTTTVYKPPVHGGGAAEVANRLWGTGQGFRARGEAAQNRYAPQTYYDAADYAREQAQAGRGQALVAAQGFRDVYGTGQGQLDYLNQVQRGQAGPSLAELQMQQGSEDAMRAMLAASQSGAGWNPAAQAQAMRYGQGIQRQNLRDTAQLRAAEQMQARSLYGQQLAQQAGALGAWGEAGRGVQGLDQAQQGLDIGRSQFATQQAMEQKRLNDAMTLGMAGYETQMYGESLRPYESELEAQIARDQMIADQVAAEHAARAQAYSAQQERAGRREASLVGGIAAGGAAGLKLLSDARSKEDLQRADARIAQLEEALASASDQLFEQTGGGNRYAALREGQGARQASRYSPRVDVEVGPATVETAPRKPQAQLSYGPVKMEPQVELQYGPGRSRYLPEHPPPAPPPTPASATVPPPPLPQGAAPALGATTPVSFRYTPEAQGRYGPAMAPRGNRYGVVAQELAQTPAGAQAVVQAPDGTLAIDPAQLAVLDAMAVGDQERRLRELERRYGRRA
jgi:hypothetical protein